MDKQGLPSYHDAMRAPTAPPPEEQSFMQQSWVQQPPVWNNNPPQPTISISPAQPVYQPQPIIFQQPPQGQQTIIVINQHIQYGENPVSMTCMHCRNSIVTKTSYENNVINHILAGVLCFMGLWCGCCCIPYCVDSIKDVKHQCPKCNTFLGLYRRGRRY